MDKKTMTKAGAGGLGAILVALSLILSSLGTTGVIEGTYTLTQSTTQTQTFVAENIDDVPDATFYDLVLNTSEGSVVIGKSNFGGDGIISANIVFNPVDNLSLIIYNSDSVEIGVGDIKKDGKIKYNIKEELVVHESK